MGTDLERLAIEPAGDGLHRQPGTAQEGHCVEERFVPFVQGIRSSSCYQAFAGDTTSSASGVSPRPPADR